ncbi:MAG: substrate-binding domain-containing protein [Armatimonadota bacterium]|nr:substrate-binding domain-containing protein [bacterium]
MRRSLPDKIAGAIYTDYIESGLIAPGERLPTVRELQRQYGRSNSIIVHALGLLDMRGVVSKGNDGACYASSEPRSTATSAVKMIGHVLPAMTEPSFVMQIHTGVERACFDFGYHVVSASANLNYEMEEQQVKRLMEAGCEAIIVTPIIRTRNQLRQDYLKTLPSGYPIVLIDVCYPEQKHIQVVLDNYRAGYDITKLLIGEGHTRIAFMESNTPNGELMHRSNSDRCDGYLRALRSAQIVPRQEDRWLLPGWYSQREETIINELTQYLIRWRSKADRPTAVIALEDFVALQTSLIARDLGISVPDDLRIVGFDNTNAANLLGASFPTTDPDMAGAGELAVLLAIQQMEGKIAESASYLLPVPIKRRVPLLEEYGHRPGGGLDAPKENAERSGLVGTLIRTRD